jgi:hypothetical protein
MNSDDNITVHDPYEKGYDFYITDKWNEKFHFKISTFEVPSGLESVAIEVIDDDPEREPRIFTILSDFEADVEEAEMRLKAKIKKGINRRHLKYRYGKLTIGQEQTLRGRIEENLDHPESLFNRFFVIDGKRITIEQFAEMIAPYPSFNFKFEIIDPADEID